MPGKVAQQATSMLYAGEHFDTDSQNYYNRARWYSPSNGRFNRMDPFAGNNRDPQSLHKYLYVHNNPVNGIDPSGLEFSLTSLVTNMAVSSMITSIIMPELLPRINKLATLLMPKWMENALEGPVTGVVLGGGISGSSNVGSAPIQGYMSASLEGILPVRPTGRGAAYFNWGFGIGLGGYGTSYSAEGYGGIVFNAKNSRDYKGLYFSLSFPLVGLPKKLRDSIINKLVTSHVAGLGTPHMVPLERWGLVEKYNKLKSKVSGNWDKVNTTVTISGWPASEVASVTIGLGYQFGGTGKSSSLTIGGGHCWQIYPSDNVHFY